MHAAKLLLDGLADDEDEDKADDDNEEEDDREDRDDEDDGEAVDLKRLKLPPGRLNLQLGFPSSLLCLPAASPCTKCQTQEIITKRRGDKTQPEWHSVSAKGPKDEVKRPIARM